MGKIIAFIYNDMADFEFTLACTLVAGNTQKEIISAAYDMEGKKGMSGFIYSPVCTVKEALVMDEIEGIIIPGGHNREFREELKSLIDKLYMENKLCASICAGPEFFAKAGILEGRKYTTTLSPERLKQAGIEDIFPRDTYTGDKVIRDGNLITALGNCFVDFAVEIIDYFGVFKDSEEKEKCAAELKGK